MSLPDSVLVQTLLSHQTLITAAARVVVRDADAAEDVFQQVVVQALEHRDDFNDAGHVLSWALRVARHRALDAARNRRAVPLDAAVLERIEAEWAADTGDRLRERLDALGRCVARLPEHVRELLRLRYGEGLPCERLAQLTGRSLAAVYQTLSRTHRALREGVEAELARGGGLE